MKMVTILEVWVFLFLPKIENKREYSVTSFCGQNSTNFGRKQFFFFAWQIWSHFDTHLNFGVVFFHQFSTVRTFFYKHFSPIHSVFCFWAKFCQILTWKIWFRPIQRIFNAKNGPNSPDLEANKFQIAWYFYGEFQLVVIRILGFFFFSHQVWGQIWLKPLMGDRHFSYITKLKKKKPLVNFGMPTFKDDTSENWMFFFLGEVHICKQCIIFKKK
jgi:hypothetical protein